MSSELAPFLTYLARFPETSIPTVQQIPSTIDSRKQNQTDSHKHLIEQQSDSISPSSYFTQIFEVRRVTK